MEFISCGTLLGAIKTSSGEIECLACRDKHKTAKEMSDTRCPAAQQINPKEQIATAQPLWQ